MHIRDVGLETPHLHLHVRGSRNIVQVRMLHYNFAFVAVLLSLGQNQDNNNLPDNMITLRVHGTCDQCLIICHKINQETAP